MSSLKRYIQSFSSLVLAVLMLVLSALAVHQDALAVPVKKMHASRNSHHMLAYHKQTLHKQAKQPVAPTKHRRPHAHRPSIVKVAIPEVFQLDYIATSYLEMATLPLTSVYRYVFFREINPPPPKAC